jgi:hypothetical protein
MQRRCDCVPSRAIGVVWNVAELDRGNRPLYDHPCSRLTERLKSTLCRPPRPAALWSSI